MKIIIHLLKKIWLFTLVILAVSIYGNEDTGFGNQIKSALKNHRIDTADIVLKKISGRKPYKLTPGDSFTFDITLENPTSSARSISYSTIILSTDYTLDIPYVGIINVKGQYYWETRELVLSLLEKTNMPINFADFRLRSLGIFEVFVYGGINIPGYITVNSLNTLMDGIQVAGGITPGASIRDIRIERDGSFLSFDLTKYLLTGAQDQNPTLLPGDKIYINKAWGICSIAGEVGFPDLYELKEGETLKDLIKTAGGITPGGIELDLEINRLEKDGFLKVYNIDYDQSGQFKLYHGDEIKVKSIHETEKKILIKGALFGKLHDKQNTPQIIPEEQLLVNIPYVSGVTLLRVLEKFGGPTPLAEAENSIIVRKGVFINIDAKKLWETREPALDVNLEAGDQIFIPSKKLTVGVGGNVGRPGIFQFDPGNTVSDYVIMAGGILPDEGSKTSIYQIDEEGKRRKINYNDYVLTPGVNLYVGRNGWKQVTYSLEQITVVIGFSAAVLALADSFIDLYGKINPSK